MAANSNAGFNYNLESQYDTDNKPDWNETPMEEEDLKDLKLNNDIIEGEAVWLDKSF